MIEGINPVPPQKQPDYDPAARQAQEARLKDASKQFEQVFMTQLFKEMGKGVEKSKVFGEGKDEDTFKEMLDQERAKAWSDSGGVGIAQLIFEQMRNQVADKTPGHGDDPMAAANEGAQTPVRDKKPDATPQKD